MFGRRREMQETLRSVERYLADPEGYNNSLKPDLGNSSNAKIHQFEKVPIGATVVFLLGDHSLPYSYPLCDRFKDPKRILRNFVKKLPPESQKQPGFYYNKKGLGEIYISHDSNIDEYMLQALVHMQSYNLDVLRPKDKPTLDHARAKRIVAYARDKVHATDGEIMGIIVPALSLNEDELIDYTQKIKTYL